MAKLVFIGHETRGKELHKLLENLGGIDSGYVQCSCITCYYYINREGYIECSNAIPLYMEKCVIMTLEEFEQKYPYKVGDKVNYVKYNDRYPSVYTIQRLRWTGVTIEYWLDSRGFSALTKDLQPYKEEIVDTGCCSIPTKSPMYKLNIKEQKDTNKVIFDTNSQCCDISNKIIEKETMKKEISGAIVDRFICLEGYDFYDDKGNIIGTKEIIMKKKKPKYPKTFIECAKILDCFCATHIDGYKSELLENLQELLICRDAYWKLAEKWKPDWKDASQDKFVIYNDEYNICLNSFALGHNVLAFPTEEIRDAFYENFKDLIESCKALL